MVAGTETTVCAISAIFQRAIDHPEIWGKDKFSKPKGWILECLLLSPPLRFTPRFAKKDIFWNGYNIKAGTTFWLSIYHANRDQNYFENALSFMPSRKLSSFLTFGFGEHKCIGFLWLGHGRVSSVLFATRSDNFANWLCKKLNRPECKVLFQVGGSFAVSTVLSLAQKVRLGKVVALKLGFLSLGLDALQITTVQKKFALQSNNISSSLKSEFIHLKQGEDFSID